MLLPETQSAQTKALRDTIHSRMAGKPSDLQYELRVTCQSSREVCWECQRFIKAVGVQGLPAVTCWLLLPLPETQGTHTKETTYTAE
jgi:hypothetical protein